MDKCCVCDGTEGKEHLAREMMFGSDEPFTYFECETCGCVQLVAIPHDMARFYGQGYYSFGDSKWQRPSIARKLLTRVKLLGVPTGRFLKGNLHGHSKHLEALAKIGINREMRILDVGCGSGDLLFLLRETGYSAEGIDKFASSSVVDAWGTRVRALDLSELHERWDLIMFHHSFEHMIEHREVLRLIKDRLTENGRCLIRIPIAEEAWRTYGTNWIQLDAPRHFILHSMRSFRLLVETCGFTLEDAYCDSDGFQFWGSELYKRKVPLSERSPNRFTMLERLSFKAKAMNLNRKKVGDQAVFLLRPTR